MSSSSNHRATPPIIEVNALSKRYKLGQFGAATFREEIEQLWCRLRGSSEGIAHNAAKQAEREFWALRDVSFTVQPGEVVGVIGRNGAGKSTLLKVLSRITEPTSGEITLRGRVASLLEVGTGFHPELSGRDNVFLNGAILGMTKKEVADKFDEIVEFSECAQFIDTPVKRYSSGMRVRLAFAVAAHLEPEILIVDEVLAVGDQQFQTKCLGKMQDVAGQGRTVLFVSHNMSTIRALCPRAMVLQNGSIILDGEANESISTYLNVMKEDAWRAFTHENPHRKHTPGKLELTGARILDELGRECTEFVAGQNITFEFDYRNPTPGSSISIGFTIYNAMGTPITHFNPKAVNQKGWIAEASAGSIRCKVEQVPLVTGEYRVAIFAAEDEAHTDTLPNALVFRVTGTTFLAPGYEPSPQFNTVLMKQQWESSSAPVLAAK